MTQEHVHPQFRDVLDRSPEERMAFLRQPRWIGYAAAYRLTATMRTLMQAPERDRMPCMLIVGDSNNGKTTIVRHFFKLHGQACDDANGQAVLPVILAEAWPGADPKGLCIAILNKFFVPFRASEPFAVLLQRVVHLMRFHHVRLLMIDEFHSLTEGPAKRQREVMNTIRYLCNALKIPIVGVGTSSAVSVLNQDQQYASRFEVKTLPLWQLNHEFQNRLLGISRVLPLLKASTLTERRTGEALHALSGGNLGNLHDIIVECGVEAIQSGSERIDLDMIRSKAFMGKKIRMADV